jgi:hypothetical protein
LSTHQLVLNLLEIELKQPTTRPWQEEHWQSQWHPRDQLSQQVEDLLAGKDLAAEALKKAEEASQDEQAEDEEEQGASADE